MAGKDIANGRTEKFINTGQYDKRDNNSADYTIERTNPDSVLIISLYAGKSGSAIASRTSDRLIT